MYRLDAEPRELRDLVSRGPWAVGVPSAARALLPGPRGSLNRVVPKATHLTILDYSAGADELEVDRLFAAASSQFEQAYNTIAAASSRECSRRRGSLT